MKYGYRQNNKGVFKRQISWQGQFKNGGGFRYARYLATVDAVSANKNNARSKGRCTTKGQKFKSRFYFYEKGDEKYTDYV